jgi:catechol 2,3-dioxygenase-like lactoylglutathione lyase family enzyme
MGQMENRQSHFEPSHATPFTSQGDRSMTRLNHINLPVSDVPALTHFFQQAFGFRLADQRGAGKFSVLQGDDGFILVLSHDKIGGPKPYPGFFHVGFLVDSTSAVRQQHQRITDAGFDAPTPAILERGGPKAYGFYHSAPGGVLVEVSTFAEESAPALT